MTYTEDDVRQGLVAHVIDVMATAKEKVGDDGELPDDVKAYISKAKAMLEPEALKAFLAELNSAT